MRVGWQSAWRIPIRRRPRAGATNGQVRRTIHIGYREHTSLSAAAAACQLCTLPAGVHWQYVEAPAIGGLINWFALPQSRYPFGVICTDRELTVEECKRYGLAPRSAKP